MQSVSQLEPFLTCLAEKNRLWKVSNSHISTTPSTLKLAQHANEVVSGKHALSLLYQSFKDESFYFQNN